MLVRRRVAAALVAREFAELANSQQALHHAQDPRARDIINKRTTCTTLWRRDVHAVQPRQEAPVAAAHAGPASRAARSQPASVQRPASEALVLCSSVAAVAAAAHVSLSEWNPFALQKCVARGVVYQGDHHVKGIRLLLSPGPDWHRKQVRDFLSLH